jgi:hypothetical protein
MAIAEEMMFIRSLILVVCVSSMAWAHIATATLSGTVTDEAGTPLIGVQVTARYLNTGNNWSEVTGKEGKYRVPALPLGSYLLSASLSGFKTDVRGVPLRSRADEVVVDFTLEAEAGSGEVTREVPPESPEVPGREPIEASIPDTTIRPDSTAPEVETPSTSAEQSLANQPGSPSTRAAGFAVQVASFRLRSKAEELRTVLERAGYPVQVVEVDIPGSGRYYRVRVGPFVRDEEAREAASNLRSRFSQRIPKVWIVPYQP